MICCSITRFLIYQACKHKVSVVSPDTAVAVEESDSDEEDVEDHSQNDGKNIVLIYLDNTLDTCVYKG